MDFREFCSQLDNNQIAMVDQDELLVYSRADLQSKEDLVEVILYPDNMISGWERFIDKMIEVPCCWILHNQDPCDPHIHIIIQWANNVQLSYYLKYLNQKLAREGINPVTGFKYCPAKLIKAVKYPEHAYEYLIHNTDKAKSEGKYQYSPLERHCCNGFDIHFVKQLDKSKKYRISKEISDHIMNYKIMDIGQLYKWIVGKTEDYYLYYESHSGYFERLCASNWKEYQRQLDKKNNK